MIVLTLMNIITAMQCATYLTKCIDLCKNTKSYIINLFTSSFIIMTFHYFEYNLSVHTCLLYWNFTIVIVWWSLCSKKKTEGHRTHGQPQMSTGFDCNHSLYLPFLPTFTTLCFFFKCMYESVNYNFLKNCDMQNFSIQIWVQHNRINFKSNSFMLP